MLVAWRSLDVRLKRCCTNVILTIILIATPDTLPIGGDNEPCAFYHPERDLLIILYVDDCLADGHEDDILKICTFLTLVREFSSRSSLAA